MPDSDNSWDAEFVSQFLDSMDGIYDSMFKDLRFLSLVAGRPLSIGLAQNSFRYLKIGLDRPGILHLSTVHLYDEHGLLSDAAINKIDMTMSTTHSVIKSSVKKLLGKGDVFSIHTEMDQDPHIVLDLQGSIDLRRILIGNRNDIWAIRAWNIYVDVSEDGKNWHRAYSASQRWEELRALGNSPYYPMGVQEQKYVSRLVDMYIDAKRFALKDIRAKSKDYKLSDFPAEVKEVLNNRLFHPVQLEFTSHGIFKSFRFWKQEVREGYLQYANEATDMLRGCSPDVCLGYGSVLGLVREQGFIDHDDDLDIILSLPSSSFGTFKQAITHVKSYAASKGFEVCDDKFPAHFKLLSPQNASLDVFVGFQEGDYVSWLPGPRNTILYDEVYPPLAADFYGQTCLIPKNPFSYLAKVYGPEWHIPNSSWQQNWSIDNYRDFF